jgi:hypothetical protein
METQAKTITMARLTPEVYADLERTVGHILVNRETTELMAGQQLGIQYVLRLLREGYVVGART